MEPNEAGLPPLAEATFQFTFVVLRPVMFAVN
jgi:hypothetical protein